MVVTRCRNGQPIEPALCQLYRHTFVPYAWQHFHAAHQACANHEDFTVACILMCDVKQKPKQYAQSIDLRC